MHHWKEHKAQCKLIKQAWTVPANHVDEIIVGGEFVGATHLIFASGICHVDLARHLLDLAADKELDSVEDLGLTPLLVACMKGMSEVAKLLVERGADVDAKNTKGDTALMLACYSGMSEVAKLLVEAQTSTPPRALARPLKVIQRS